MPHPNNLTDMGVLKGQGSYWSRKSTTQLDSMGAYCILFQQAGFEIIVLASLYSKLIHKFQTGQMKENGGLKWCKEEGCFP